MNLYRPLKANYVTQSFGQNLLPIYKKMGMLGHNGIDFRCWRGASIYHSADWEGVAKTEVDRAGGIGVDVISKMKFMDTHWKLRYWHLKKVNVYDGQIINPGDVIGFADSTGYSTGDHLHWGLKPCNADGKSTSLDHGYYGAVNPDEFYENKFILNVIKEEQEMEIDTQIAQIINKYGLLRYFLGYLRNIRLRRKGR